MSELDATMGGRPGHASPPPPAPDPAATARRRRLLILGAIAAVGVVALGLVAVLAVSSNPLSRLGNAADATIGAGTARTEVSTTLLGLPFAPELDAVLVVGELDLEAQQASMVRTLPAIDRLPMVGRFLDDAVELRYDGGDAYAALPLSADRRWVRVTGAAARAAEPAPAPGLSNPLIVVEVLRSVVGEPEEVGIEAIRGVETTHFTAVVDLDRATIGLPERSQQVVRDLIRLRGSGDMPIEVWLDADDRVRRITTEVDADFGIRLGLRTTVELFDLGEPVDTAPPGDDELIDVTDIDLPELNPMEALRNLLDRIPGIGG